MNGQTTVTIDHILSELIAEGTVTHVPMARMKKLTRLLDMWENCVGKEKKACLKKILPALPVDRLWDFYEYAAGSNVVLDWVTDATLDAIIKRSRGRERDRAELLRCVR